MCSRGTFMHLNISCSICQIRRDSLQQPNFQPFSLIMIHSVECLQVITGQSQENKSETLWTWLRVLNWEESSLSSLM